ncbi:MAG: hypothetical protein ACREDA_00560 [Methylocella sp.]
MTEPLAHFAHNSSSQGKLLRILPSTSAAPPELVEGPALARQPNE